MGVQRIAIWGNSGSGKSTLAERLAEDLDLPVYHVDRIAWRAGWEYANETTFLAAHQVWLDEPAWIIDGVGPVSGLKARFARAGLIVFLDTPLEICRARALQRIEDDRREQNRFITDGCRYSAVIEKQWEVIERFSHEFQTAIARIAELDFPATPRLRLDGRKSTADLCAETRSAITLHS